MPTNTALSHNPLHSVGKELPESAPRVDRCSPATHGECLKESSDPFSTWQHGVYRMAAEKATAKRCLPMPKGRRFRAERF